MKLTTILITAALAGCATSPQEVIDRGTRHTGEIAKAPMDAAKCIARSAEYSGNWLTTTQETGAGQTEVLLKSSAASYMTMAIWRFSAAGSGSRYEAWVNPDYMPSHAELLKSMRGSC